MAFSGALPLRQAAVIIGAAGALAAGMLAAAGPASAQAQPACGQTLTASVTLTANLDCTGDTTTSALTIGAAGITVDLNRYAILGPGDSAGTDGINDQGYSGLTVENGTISDFSTDVNAEGTSGSDLTGVVLRHLTTTDDTLQQSTAVNGEYLDGASIQHLSVRDADTGVNLENSDGSAISYGRFTAPVTGISDTNGAGNLISHNTMSGAADYGINVDGSSGDVIRFNAVTGGRGGDGILFYAIGSIISRNVLNDVFTGLYDEGGVANTVSGNSGSGDGWGLYADQPEDETYSGNTFSHGGYGIEADYPSGTTLKSNTTDDNSEAGVYVYTNGETGYAVTLNRNTADGNRFGLYSQIPTSGSGNHAAHNKVVNCYNVSCTKAARGGGRIAAPPHHALGPAPAAIRPGKR